MGLILLSFRAPDGLEPRVVTALVQRIEERTGAEAQCEGAASGDVTHVKFRALASSMDVMPHADGMWHIELSPSENPYFLYHLEGAIEDIGGAQIPLGATAVRAHQRIERWDRPWQQLGAWERMKHGPMRSLPLILMMPVLTVAFVVAWPALCVYQVSVKRLRGKQSR